MYHCSFVVYQPKKGGDKMKKEKTYVGIDIGKKGKKRNFFFA